MKKIFTSILLLAFMSLSAFAENYVLEYDREIKLTTGLTDYGGVQSQALALNGVPYQLTFEGKQASLAVNSCYVQYSADGASSWIDLVKPDCNTNYQSFGPYELPANATHIRFNAKTGSTLNRTFRNIKVTSRTTYGSDIATFCTGDSIEYNGTWYYEAGVQENILLAEKNSRDGDSIVTLTLNVLPSYSFPESQTIYVGAEESWHKQALSGYAVGTYTLYDSLQTVLLCDSVYTLALTVLERPTTYGTYAAAFCPGDSIEYNGVWYYEAGTYADLRLSEKNVLGGDSLVTLTITLHETYDLSDELIVLEEGTDSLWHGIDLALLPVGDTLLIDSLHTELGCDSIISVAVTITEKLEGPTTSLSDENVAPAATKLFRQGALYIRRDDVLFDLRGSRVE